MSLTACGNGQYETENTEEIVSTPTPTPAESSKSIDEPANEPVLIAPQITLENIDNREYSDDELNSMLAISAQELRTKINTRADAIAFLNIKFPELWMSLHLWIDGSEHGMLRSAEGLLNDGWTNAQGVCEAGRSDINTAVTYLLSDNAVIGSLYGFCFVDDMPIKAANYIYLDSQYHIFDAVLRMDGDEMSRAGELLPEMTVSNLTEYASVISESILGYEIDILFAVEDGVEINFSVWDGWATLTSPEIEPLYINTDKDMTDPINIERFFGHIKAENINLFNLSSILGGTTLSVDDANALVGKSASEIKEKVNTAGDLLMYMLAAKLMLRNGCICQSAGGHTWHYNPNVHITLKENLGNCGRMANVANYILEGKYEEIGFINHSYPSGGGGGHIYNYIKHQGKYYIVDFSSYLFNNYSLSNEMSVISLDELDDFGTRWREVFGGIAAVIAYKSPGTDLPVVFGEDSGEPGIIYYPEGADFTILYETPGTGIEIRTIPVPTQIPDWKVPQ